MTKWYDDTKINISRFFYLLCPHGAEKRREKEMKVEGCVIHRSMLLIPAVPLNLPLFTAGWCTLDSFLLL